MTWSVGNSDLVLHNSGGYEVARPGTGSSLRQDRQLITRSTPAQSDVVKSQIAERLKAGLAPTALDEVPTTGDLNRQTTRFTF